MKTNTEAKIAKPIWLTVIIGGLLLVAGIILTLKVNAALGLAVTVGAQGWFALGLMMSPQVRKDLFGDLFERDQALISREPQS